MSTILKNLIQLIKNETLPSANTANRVGTTLEYIDTEKADRENTYTKSEVMDLVNEIKLLASSGAKFIGSITPTTPINPDGNIWAFAEAGTYPNSGGLVVNPNTLTILSRAEGVWGKIEIPIAIKSITGIQKTNTSGLEDTYTISFSDGSNFNFVVTNGKEPVLNTTFNPDDNTNTSTDKATGDWVMSKIGGKVESGDTNAVSGGEVYSYLINNTEVMEIEEDLGPFIQGFYSDYTDGASVKPFVSYQCLAQIDATDIYKVSLSGLTRNHGLWTFYGRKKADGVFESIYEPANNTTLVNEIINIEQGKYDYLYINLQSSVTAKAIVFKRTQKEIYVDGSEREVVGRIKSVAKYFLENEFRHDFTLGKFYQMDGSIFPYANAKYMEIDAEGISKLIVNAETRNYDQGYEVLIGKRKSDGQLESIYNTPNYILKDHEFPIEVGKYSKLWLNVRDTYVASYVEIVRDRVNFLKTYIDNNSGGGGINIPNTVIYAEKHGVSALNSPSNNSTIINELIDNNKEYGAYIILPLGEIKIADTIQLWNTVSLIGALRGRTETNGIDVRMHGGTKLKATQSGVMINLKKYLNNFNSQAIKKMQLDGSNIASTGIYAGEGNAFFTIEEMDITDCTNLAIETEGALLYTMRNMRILRCANGVHIKRTLNYQCNHIRFEMVQFQSIPGVATLASGGAQIVFEQCDWEQNGTVGNVNTGNVLISNMSPSGEGIDLTFNNCWSEYVSGGFWLKIATNCKGVTTFRDSMLWRLSGDAQRGIINNGAKVLIEGSTRINDFPVDVETINNGETRINGFTKIGTHTENTGGTYKTAVYS